jgi:hypothetical protein
MAASVLLERVKIECPEKVEVDADDWICHGHQGALP